MRHTPVLLALVLAAAIAAPAQAADSPKGSAAPDSLAQLEKAVARDSSNFDNLYRLGVMYLDRERGREATTVLTKAHVLKPKNVKAMVNLGAAFDMTGHAKTAQVYYREAIQVAPGDSVAMCRLASSEYAVGDYSGAMDHIRAILKKDPKAHCAYFTLGVAFADAGIYRDAIRMWKKVVEYAPNSPEASSAKESIDVLERYIGVK